MKDEALIIINNWIETNEKLREITKYLYEHTELFEMKYMDEFLEELHGFFAGKITRSAKDYNKLMELLGNKNIQRMNYLKMIRR